MQSMLFGAPWLLAHKSMLAVNQPRKVSLYGTDSVMWKDPAGAIHALPNACPHMGAMLSEGWCEAYDSPETSPRQRKSGIVCPFHALKFDAEGCTVLPGLNQKTLPLLKPLERLSSAAVINFSIFSNHLYSAVATICCTASPHLSICNFSYRIGCSDRDQQSIAELSAFA
jgi:nitrite reductase/ring-hydroxylating ferredoxin subunit